MPLLDTWNIQLTADDVLRLQGADPAQVRLRRPGMVNVAEWAAQESLPLLQPQVLYQEFTVQGMTHERINLQDGPATSRRLYLAGPLVAEHLRGASQVITLLCTIGPQLEEIASALIHEDLLRGLALDAAGSAATETLATCASHYFEARAASQGWQCSLPLNPGMEGWAVPEGQEQVFNLLADELQTHVVFPVSLNAAYSMIPQKTISLVLGVGAELKPAGKICDYCNLRETCRYQRQ
jgi:hypothetical protein